MNVLITTPVPDEKTAWTKGRMDVMQILRQKGYAVVELPAGASPGEWFRLVSGLNAMLEKDDHILIEYPMDQRKRTYVLYLFSLLRRVKLYAFIHDLNSLRIRLTAEQGSGHPETLRRTYLAQPDHDTLAARRWSLGQDRGSASFSITARARPRYGTKLIFHFHSRSSAPVTCHTTRRAI